MSTDTDEKIVDILILGAGWTSDFLIPYLDNQRLTYAATRRSLEPNPKYRLSIIPGCIQFDLATADEFVYKSLPNAKTVLVSFPLEPGQASKLVKSYSDARSQYADRQWILLGSTGIFDADIKQDYNSPYKKTPRSEAEDELLSLPGIQVVVLCLAGLWGHSRQPRNWVKMVASTEEKLLAKKSLHLIHGEDVARSIVGCIKARHTVNGRRWIVTDEEVYDWWKLIWDWTHEHSQEREWISGGMYRGDIKSLPRNAELLGRTLDSHHFWNAIDSKPKYTLEHNPDTSNM